MSSTTSSTSDIFTGSSRYSSDFQSVISRAVSIASLPLQQLSSQKDTYTAQSTALSSLNTKFSALQSSISSLDSTIAGGMLTASSSDTSVAQANATSGAFEGSYALTVVSLGSLTNTLSEAGATPVTDPSKQGIDSASNYTLTVNGVSRSLSPADGSLNSLVSAINSNSDLGVRATIVNVGSGTNLDYRLSIQSTEYGDSTIQLTGSQDLMDTVSSGSPVQYQLQGQSTTLESNSRTLTLSPGLTATVIGTGSTTITTAHDSTSLGNSLTDFVNSYNAAVDELGKSRGQNAGALNGQTIVVTLGQSLEQLGSFTTSDSSVSSLAALGLEFDKTGHLSLDRSVLTAATTNNYDSVMKFLGGADSGGFLKSATDALNSIEDSTDGALTTAISSTQTAIQHQTDLMATEQDRVDQLQQNLTDQMNAADAAIATMEQQVLMIQGIFSTSSGNSSSS